MCTGNGPDWPSETEQDDFIELENHPKRGLQIVAKIGRRWGHQGKDETKQCAGVE